MASGRNLAAGVGSLEFHERAAFMPPEPFLWDDRSARLPRSS